MNAKLFLLLSSLFVIPGCSDSGTNQMSVKVIDEQGQGIANIPVVIGNQAGLVNSYLTTNGVGEAHFTSTPANATVTVASSCYSSSYNRTYYSVDTNYDVNVTALTVTMGRCTENTQQVDITVTDAIAGITSSDITIGAITYNAPSITMDVASGLQDDGTVSVFASGYDDEGNILGYGFALDQPAVDGTKINITINRTDLVQNSHSLINVPADTVSYYAYASLLRKHGATNLPFNSYGDLAPVPATITTYSAVNFSDNNMLGATVMLDRDNDGTADANIGFVRYLPNASNQVFDFNATPAAPAALTYDQDTNGRPAISWSNRDPLSTVKTLTLSYRAPAPERKSYSYTMTVPASATSLAFPELPEELAAYRPTAYDTLSLQTLKFDSQMHYADFLKAINTHSGRFYEEVGFESYSYASVSRVP